MNVSYPRHLQKTAPKRELYPEEPDSHEEGMVTGRLSNNITVHFKGGTELIGTIVDVYLDESKGFYYMGTLCEH